MAEIAGDTVISLDGETDFDIGSSTYSWASERWLESAQIWSSPTGSQFTATVNLFGLNWNIGQLRFDGNVQVVINDSATTDANRYIGYLALESFGGATVTLVDTKIGMVRTGDAAVNFTTGNQWLNAFVSGAGADVVNIGAGAAGSVDLGQGDNKLTSSGHIDYLQAREGDDIVNIGAGGANSVELGYGDNSLTSDGYIGNFTAYDGNDLLNIGIGGAGSIELGEGDNRLTSIGYVGALRAYDGDDTVGIGSGGAGSIELGHGDNVLNSTGNVGVVRAYDGDDRVTIGSLGAGMVDLGYGDDIFSSTGRVNNLNTSDGDDTITIGVGGAGEVQLGEGNNQFYSTGRVNTVSASQGNDIFQIGAGGAAFISAGAGDDEIRLARLSQTQTGVIQAGDGVDTVSFAGFDMQLSINLAAYAAMGASKYYLLGVENVTGGSDNDTITGDQNNNVLVGLGGNDIINGSGGVDRMEGGAGNDIYYVDSVSDLAIEKNGAGVDTVYASVSFNFGAQYLDNLVLTGSGVANGTGNGLNNVMTGNAGANVLSGLAGADKLNGGLGNDRLAGGAGGDIFVFNTRAHSTSNRDAVTDFTNVSGNDDIFHLENAIFTKLATGALKAANFKLGAAAGDANDYVIYNKATGILSYDADGNGAGAAVQVALLTNKAALTVADFLVI